MRWQLVLWLQFSALGVHVSIESVGHQNAVGGMVQPEAVHAAGVKAYSEISIDCTAQSCLANVGEL